MSRPRRSLACLAAAAAAFVSSVVSAQCTDVHVVFARGSGEMQGFGICGQPFVQGITSALQGMSVSSYAVNYMADVAQTSAGPGATDMTNHVVQVAQQCPSTVFVLGGYSQGATVTDIAIGIRTGLGSGQVIPTSLAPRIKAVVTFGNPLKLTGGTIASSSQLYGSKAIEMCNTGDPVCAGGFNFMAHTTYPTDGSVARAAQQAAQLVQAGGGGTPSQGQGQGQNVPQSESRANTGASGFPNLGQSQGNAPVNTAALPNLGSTGNGGGLSSLGQGLGGIGTGAGGMPGLGGGGMPSIGGGGMPSLGGGGMPSLGGAGNTGMGSFPNYGFGNFLRGSS